MNLKDVLNKMETENKSKPGISKVESEVIQAAGTFQEICSGKFLDPMTMISGFAISTTQLLNEDVQAFDKMSGVNEGARRANDKAKVTGSINDIIEICLKNKMDHGTVLISLLECIGQYTMGIAEAMEDLSNTEIPKDILDEIIKSVFNPDGCGKCKDKSACDSPANHIENSRRMDNHAAHRAKSNISKEEKVAQLTNALLSNSIDIDEVLNMLMKGFNTNR